MPPVYNKRLWGTLIAGMMIVCTLGAMAVTNGAAAAPASEGEQATPRSTWRPEATTPPRQPEATTASGQPAPTKAPVKPGSNPALWTPTPEIAGIAIRVINPPEKAWVQIQWSDWSMQAWYAVNEWSGPLAQSDYGWGAVYYGSENFGKGPFRWVVFDGNPAEGGAAWGISEIFYLDYLGGMFTLKEVNQGQNLETLGTMPGIARLPDATATPDPRLLFYSPQGAELKANPAGCGRYAIAGEVLSASGRPLSEYRLRLTYPTGISETVNAGGAPDYGKSGYGFLLGAHHSGQAYKLELLPKGPGGPIAPAVKIMFSDSCTSNYAWVVFQSQH